MFNFSLNREINHFKVLGLDSSSDMSDADIKKAYHRLAKEFHPDLNKDKIGAIERFRLIQSSYEAINTKEKRLQYIDLINDSDSWNRNNREGGGYANRSNYTDVSNDFDRAYDKQSAKASRTKWGKFMFRSLFHFERIVHPTYLFGVVLPVLGISYWLSSTLKQRINNSYNNNNNINNNSNYNKYNHQHNTIFSTNLSTIPSEWYNSQAKR